MILAELLDCGVEDSIVAEQLVRPVSSTLRILAEANYNIVKFKYDKSKNDPTPKVLVFGRWAHPRSTNKLVCGINLNYLSPEQEDALQQALPAIMTKPDTKGKYYAAATLVPDIMKVAYRTYDEKFSHNVTKSVYEVPDAVANPEQQQIEPFNKPALPIERGPAEPPVDAGVDLTPDKDGAIDEPQLDEIGIDSVAAPAPTETPETPTPSEPPSTPEAAPEAPENAEKPDEEKSQPEKQKEVLSNAKEMIQKLSTMVKDKQDRNQSEDDQPPASDSLAAEINQEPVEIDDKEQAEQEAHELQSIEAEERALGNDPEPDDIIPGLQTNIDDDLNFANDQLNGLGESFENRLDVLLEKLNFQSRGSWTSPQEYIDFHSPGNFFAFQEKLGNTVLECSKGTRFLAAFHIPSQRMIIDLADSHFEMLEEAGWTFQDTIRFSVDKNQINTSSDAEGIQPLVESVLSSSVGSLFTALLG